MTALVWKRKSWISKKKCPHAWIFVPLTLPRRPCVLPFLIVSLNFVTEPETSREAAALDVFTAWGSLRGHKSIFFYSSFWLLKASIPCRGIPLLPAVFSPAPRCMSSALPFGDETSSHFSHPSPGGLFPWYTWNNGFDLKLLSFLSLKNIDLDCVLFL